MARAMGFFQRLDSFFLYLYFGGILLTSVLFLVSLWSEIPLRAYGFGFGLQRTAATVVESRMVSHVYGQSPFFSGELAVIKYRYDVDGKQYESDRLSTEQRFALPLRADSSGRGSPDHRSRTRRHRWYVSEYFLGRSVTAHYNPANASFAVLDPSFPIWRVFVSVLFVAMGWLAAFLLRRHYLARRKMLAPKRTIRQCLEDLERM
jgi:Protein of unknown function (DUF3592)